MDITQFSVVIVAETHNPTILNPDFLRHNGITDQRWQPVEEEVFTTPILSRVGFDNGFLITADPSRVVFEQSGDPLLPESLACASAAKGYLKTVPHVPYRALGTNLTCAVRNSSICHVSNALKSDGAWMSFQSVVPRFELKAIYEMTDKRVTLDIQEGSEATAHCRINIHRDIKEPNQQMRISSMLSILDSWHSDLAVVQALIAQASSLDRTSRC